MPLNRFFSYLSAFYNCDSSSETILIFLNDYLPPPLLLLTTSTTPQPSNSIPMHAATEKQIGAITEINYQLEGHLNTHPEKKMTTARD